jgi:hypothetical protein
MKKLTACCFLVAAIALLALTGALHAAEGAIPIPVGSAEGLQEPSSDKGTACTLVRHNGDEAYYTDIYRKGMRTVTYFNPASCGTPTYPFEIYCLQFPLWDAGERPWPLKVQVVIYSTMGGDSCAGPGIELYRAGIQCDSVNFAIPRTGSAWLPTPFCVNEPFFIGIEYDDNKPFPYPSLIFDSAMPADCHNWLYINNVWRSWLEYWPDPVPGYPLFTVKGERNATSNCQPDSSKVKINEINTYATGYGTGDWTTAWIELYNSSNLGINVNGWHIAKKSGVSIATLPDWTMYGKSYLRICLGTGTDDPDFSDGRATYFTQRDSVGEISDVEEEIGLYKGAVSADKIIDFVIWSSNGAFNPGVPYTHALTKHVWRADDIVSTANYGLFSTLGLRPSGFDHDNSADWHEYDWGTYQTGGYNRVANPIQIYPPYGFSIGQGTALQWSTCTGAAQYFLEVDQDSLFQSPDLAVYTTDTSYSTSGLASGNYFWRVRVKESVRLFLDHEVSLFYLNDPPGSGPDSVFLEVSQELQHKDSRMLCVSNDADFSASPARPGCSEGMSTRGPWNAAHPKTREHIIHCEHCAYYSARAAIAMINDYFHGTLTQDHISYYSCESTIRDKPESDLGHQRGLRRAPAHELGNTLNWALTQPGVSEHIGKPTYAEVVTQVVTNSHPTLVCVTGHALVIDGTRLAGGRQQVHVVDPWPSARTAGSGARTGWSDYAGMGILCYYTLPSIAITALTESATLFTDTDHDSLVDFEEGLGTPDYPNDRPRKFQSKYRSADSDSDQVSDFAEIKNYVFHDQIGYHPGHENNALTFPDIDGDGLRAEHDPDSDNDGDFDGGEDVDGDGKNPESDETCQFDNTSMLMTVHVNKDLYSVGEVVYVVDLPGVRETRSFHENSTYNAENGENCSPKPNGSPLVHNSYFVVDEYGHAVASPIDTCPYPGTFHLCVDILNDGKYSAAQGLDPVVCWECGVDTTRGWHFGYDFPYYHSGSPWPPYEYPALCTIEGSTNIVSSIEVPWWWRSGVWPPPIDNYWLGIGIPKSLITSGIVRIDTLPAFAQGGLDCGGATIRQFALDTLRRNDLNAAVGDPSISWYGYSISNWRITDSVMTTRIKITIAKQYADSIAPFAVAQIRTGDALYGWSPTYYDQVGLLPLYIPGDANNDGAVDISDAVYLIAYIFTGGAAPSPLKAGDANCDSAVDISDAVYLIAYIFTGGAAPCK